MNKKTIKYSDDEDCEFDNVGEPTLGYSYKTRVNRSFRVHINTDIREPSYYSKIFDMLLDANEGDVVTFMIESPGGRLDGLNTLLEGIKMTDAHVMALVVGEASSAASILALNCHEVIITDGAEGVIHSCRFSSGGKAADVRANVDHTLKITEKLARETYGKGFLTEAELNQMLDGKEFYFDADQLRERIRRRVEYLEQEAELEELQKQELSAEKPSKKKKK